MEEKKVSRIKIGLCALLGYAILNIIRNTLYTLSNIIINIISSKFIRYRLQDIAFFLTFYVGFMASYFIGEKMLKEDDAVRRYIGTIGILFIINYAYFIVDYFRYGEGTLFYLICSFGIGIYLLFSNRETKKQQ